MVVICLIANIALAFLFYYFFSVEIQLYSLAGITISLGLIIDNSIVMIDHIKNQKNKNAFIPIFASTLTTIGALSIIHFLDKDFKINLVDFAMVIIINLTISLFIALFFIPALLCKINLSTKKEKRWIQQLKNGFYSIYRYLLVFLIKNKSWTIAVIIFVFGIPFYMLPQSLEGQDTWYKKVYNQTIGNEFYKENIRPYVDRYLGGTSRLFSYYVFENANYRLNEETKIIVNASMEKGNTVHQMNEAFIEIENYLYQFHQINQFTSYVASGQYAHLEVTFKPKYERSSFPFLLKSRLAGKVSDFEGIKWNIYGVGNIFALGGSGAGEAINFSVEAKGYNYDELNSWCDSLSVLLSTHPRVKNIIVRENSKRYKIPSYEYSFKLKKEKLALDNISPIEVVDNLKNNTLSKKPSLFLNIDKKYTPVRLEAKYSKDFDIWDIKHLPSYISEKPTIVKGVLTISKQKEDENIYKVNQEYIRKLDFKYTGAITTGKKYLNTALNQMKLKAPLGYAFKKTNLPWIIERQEKENYTKYLFLIMVIIYFICSILFENLKQAFIILSIIPISFIGVFITFYWFDFNFDQGGLASFVLLSGITVNASIYLICQFNIMQKKFPYSEKITLYLQTFKQKIFTILLTITSTILGFIPFIKDGQQEVFWFSLGVGTIGGLLTSLMGILIYLPVFTLKRNAFIK
ncbi:MAG: efflux RND transporter permease subunit [Tenacibaculum sp.]